MKLQTAHTGPTRMPMTGMPDDFLPDTQQVVHDFAAPAVLGWMDETSQTLKIAASVRPTLITVTSRVNVVAAPAAPSAAYVAARRRKRIADIIRMIDELAVSEAREDFAVCTFPITDEIRKLLASLLDVETEGATREVLRQVRDTMLNSGWNRYREATVRTAVVRVLALLTGSDQVDAATVDIAFDQLFELQRGVLAAMLGHGDETDEASH